MADEDVRLPRDLETESPETRDSAISAIPTIRDAPRRVPERTLTPAPHARARPHRRTPGSSPPTRKAARRSLRCVDAERETRGFAIHFIRHPRRRRRARSDFFSTTAISDPSNTASSSNVDRSRRRDARKEAHTRSARSATRPERTRRATRLEKILREKAKSVGPTRQKKKARRARGRASPRAPRATEYKRNRTRKKTAKSRETNREPLPFRPSPLFAARRFSPMNVANDRNSSP